VDDLSRYEVEIDLDDLNTSHAAIADLIGPDRTVLDVGCWTGDLGRALATRGCTVTGVEVDADAAERARVDFTRVETADVEETALSSLFDAGSFDAVVFGDVLEHLRDPARVLRDATTLLAPGGRIVLSVPNVTHGSLRLAVLQGQWRYTERGLLDSTHLRFFDRAGLLTLLREAGLTVDELRGTLADPLAVEVDIDPARVPDTAVEWVRDQPDALVYQFVVAAHVGEPTEGTDVPLTTAVSTDDVRRSDVHTERFTADLERRHRQLTVRDHIIGLEAATATAQTRAEIAERQLRGAQKRLDRKNDRIRQLAAEVDDLRRSADERSRGAQGVLGRLRPGRPDQ
jgi:2-polyprenyl-3-methyl-5-hydroxy-6-metoxy-1,4-benzoquinol methylase